MPNGDVITTTFKKDRKNGEGSIETKANQTISVLFINDTEIRLAD